MEYKRRVVERKPFGATFFKTTRQVILETALLQAQWVQLIIPDLNKLVARALESTTLDNESGIDGVTNSQLYYGAQMLLDPFVELFSNMICRYDIPEEFRGCRISFNTPIDYSTNTIAILFERVLVDHITRNISISHNQLVVTIDGRLRQENLHCHFVLTEMLALYSNTGSAVVCITLGGFKNTTFLSSILVSAATQYPQTFTVPFCKFLYKYFQNGLTHGDDDMRSEYINTDLLDIVIACGSTNLFIKYSSPTCGVHLFSFSGDIYLVGSTQLMQNALLDIEDYLVTTGNLKSEAIMYHNKDGQIPPLFFAGLPVIGKKLNDLADYLEVPSIADSRQVDYYYLIRQVEEKCNSVSELALLLDSHLSHSLKYTTPSEDILKKLDMMLVKIYSKLSGSPKTIANLILDYIPTITELANRNKIIYYQSLNQSVGCKRLLVTLRTIYDGRIPVPEYSMIYQERKLTHLFNKLSHHNYNSLDSVGWMLTGFDFIE